jgi:aryl-alcohol dehydrogenase-like predicted oxidoreductase
MTRSASPGLRRSARCNLIKRDIEPELLPVAEAYRMSGAAWGPLAGGVLSGKFTDRGEVQARTRISHRDIREYQHSVVRVVQDVANQLGVTASQVAIAWVRSRSHAIDPIIGARRLEQLAENLGALNVTLPAELVARLDAATQFEVGFPTDFIVEIAPWVCGDTGQRIDGRGQRSI